LNVVSICYDDQRAIEVRILLFVEHFWAVFIHLAETCGNINSLPADGYKQQTGMHLSTVLV